MSGHGHGTVAGAGVMEGSAGVMEGSAGVMEGGAGVTDMEGGAGVVWGNVGATGTFLGVVDSAIDAHPLWLLVTTDIGGVSSIGGKYSLLSSSASELSEFALVGGSPCVDANSRGEAGDCGSDGNRNLVSEGVVPSGDVTLDQLPGSVEDIPAIRVSEHLLDRDPDPMADVDTSMNLRACPLYPYKTQGRRFNFSENPVIEAHPFKSGGDW
ncbi:hypothetical protein BKA83DRAFT_4486365 [Pisolithus microcarpus]|nr:hypothetical protein BKA83DRAFT_4486365 [Pisolithus microcarpus]